MSLYKLGLVKFIALIIATVMLPTNAIKDNVLWQNLTRQQQDNAPIELKASVADLTVSEFKLFSAVVEAESDRKQGSIEGRVMIAIVILNRVDSKKFPNTITKVIKQKGQFSVVSTGAYKRVGRTALSDRAVIEAVNRHRDGKAPKVLYFRSGHYFRGHKRYAKVGDNYFSY
jgi:spore germination cell wall hydrolase CwlJ-like protein